MSRIKGSVVSKTDIEIYEELKDAMIIAPIYQRAYAWNRDNAAPFVKALITNGKYDAVVRHTYEDHLGTIVLYANNNTMKIGKDNNPEVIDGGNRVVTMAITIMAINDFITNNRLKICKIDPLNVMYDEEVVNKEWAEFCLNRSSSNRFTDIYHYIYEELKSNYRYIDGTIDYLKHGFIADFKICNDASVGYTLFETINTAGKTLEAKDFIHSTLKQYSKQYGVSMSYSCDNIVTLTQCYYKVKEPESAKKRFTNSTIKDFMDTSIVRTAEDLMEFRTYLENVEDFEKTTLYQAMDNIGRSRVSTVAYALIAAGYKIDGTDKDINNLLLGLINFGIMASYKGMNPSGSTGEMFDSIIRKIGRKESIKDIFAFVKSIICEEFKNNRVHYNEFVNGIDALGDNKHIAIMLTDLWCKNHSANFNKLSLEHAYVRSADEVWTKDWPLSEDDSKALVNNIGNKFLLGIAWNRKASNKPLETKAVYYAESYETELGLNTPLNAFDALRYLKEKVGYANTRKEAYIRFLYQLPLGKEMMLYNR